jgi:hypothetical protein
MAVIWENTTPHFAVGFEVDNPQGWDLNKAVLWELGKSILTVCEGDYVRLKHLFGGIDLPWTVQVLVGHGAGGVNWPDGDGKSWQLRTGDAGASGNRAYDNLRNSFIAELAEIFMVAQKGKWNRADSKGEALSRVLGGLFYPGGQQGGFTVHQWVDNDPDPRDKPTGPLGLEDWVTKIDDNDTRAKSIGCGVAFLHYLRYQLGYSFEQIIADSGDSLADIYTHLTGRTDAFARFAQLVRGTFPAGRLSGLNASSQFPDSDMLFPLFELGLSQGVGRGVCARTSDHLDVFWIDGRHDVQTAWWDGSQAGWHPYPIGGTKARPGSPITAVARRTGHLDVFWIGPDNLITTAWWDAGFEGWHPYVIGNTETRADSWPAVICRHPDHLDLFWIGLDNNVWTTWWDAAFSGWHAYPIAGASAASGSHLTVVARTPFHLDVFWIAPSGAIRTAGWDATGVGWSVQEIPSTQARAGSAIAAIARYPDQLDVFWIGQNNAIQTAWRNAGSRGWNAYPINGNEARGDSQLAAIARYPDHIDLFWIGLDHNVWTTWWDAGFEGWHPYPVADRSAQQHSPIEVIARLPSHLDLFWYGADHRVDTAWWDAGFEGWHPYPIEGTQVGDIRFRPPPP